MQIRCPGRTPLHFALSSFTLVLGLLASRAAVAAPLNIESIRRDVAGTGSAIHVDGNFGSTFGNVFSIDAGTAITLAQRVGRHFALAAASWNFSTRALYKDGARLADVRHPSNRTTHRAHAHFRYGYDLTPVLALEGFAQYQGDEIRLLQLRLLVGGGLRFTVIKTPRGGLQIGTSYFAEWETLHGSEQPFVAWHRWSSYIAAHAQSESVSFSATAYVQPRLDDFSDLRLIADAELEFSITQHASFVSKAGVSFDAQPPEFCNAAGRQTNDCAPESVISVAPIDVSFSQSLRLRF